MYALEVKGVKKVYPNGTQALKGLDLVIEEGDFYALLGHNGAGKSTLINIISSIINPTSGTVKVMGNDLFKYGNKARPYLGVVNQEFNFSPHESVYSIIFFNATYFGMTLKEAKERALAWIDMLGLGTFKDKKMNELSGGMKRRVMIARALIHNPKILILDEPTAGVDVTLRRELWDFLIKLNKSGTTIILTTHYLEEAEYLCRNIGIIQNGNLIVNTSMRKFLSENSEGESFILDTIEPLNQEFEYKEDMFLITTLNNEQLRVKLEAQGNISKVFEILRDKGISIKSLRNESNRLENVFMKYDTDRNR